MRHLLSAFLLVSWAASAQEITHITISTNPSGLSFSVDGRVYQQPASFAWPKGSKHVVAVPGSRTSTIPIVDNGEQFPCREATFNTDPKVQYDPLCRTRFIFAEWRENTGKLGTGAELVQTITADSGLTSLVAEFTVEYKLNITFFQQPGGPFELLGTECSAGPLGPRPASAGPGVVFVNGACYPYSTSLFLPAGELSLQAVPYEGFVFRGWSFDVGPGQPSLGRYNLTGPATIVPRFEQGKRVRFYTNPSNLEVFIDNTRVKTADPATETVVYPRPGHFDWAMNSKHILSAVSPQDDANGRAWVFDKWDFGGGQESMYTVSDVLSTETFTAKFVPGANIALATAPAGLKLKVQGRENLPHYTFTWGLGMTYAISAPAEQTDSKGRKYLFKEWSNGGPADQELVITREMVDKGLRLIATYERVPQLLIRSSGPGAWLKVDGAECALPCTVDKPAGTTVSLSVPASIPVSEVTRLEFDGWTDGGGANRTITISGDQTTIQANYRTLHRLIVVADPADGANLQMDPVSTDGFYPADSAVTIVAEPRPGHKFLRWDGELSGTDPAGTVFLNAPGVVRALLEKVPFIAPAGVRNAAGETPQDAVAAGSTISIFGASLTAGYQAGPASPLAQTLMNTAVQIGDRLLPLVYVSPEQINAVLPADLPEGEHTLAVKTEGQQDVTAQFNVVRNAPGLFSNLVDDQPFVVALHEDGTAITRESPARRSETITILGTGFGPYSRPVIEGFAVPDSPVNSLVDPAELVVGPARVQPAFAGAAPGFVGLSSLKIRVGPELPTASTVEIHVSINGQDSNRVLLPLE